ncbi:MAG: hypothetical protein HXY25_02075 [Alphaproteobacteria bacterium]|nr:hypothetical protein [Alphaproteobacteria bacterium]
MAGLFDQSTLLSIGILVMLVAIPGTFFVDQVLGSAAFGFVTNYLILTVGGFVGAWAFTEAYGTLAVVSRHPHGLFMAITAGACVLFLSAAAIRRLCFR